MTPDAPTPPGPPDAVLPGASPSGAPLSTRALRGTFWTFGAVLTHLLVTLLFYRSLPVAGMGQFQGALTLVLFLPLVGRVGLDMALVQLRDATEVHFDTAFWASLALGLLLAVLGAAAAPVAARFSDDPEAFRRLLAVLALLVPFATVSGVLRARLERQLRFASLAAADVVAAVGAALAGVAALTAGWGLWSTAANAVAREALYLVAVWWAAAWRPRLRFQSAALRRLLPFGFHLTGATGVNYLCSNLDYLFILYALGDDALGAYAFAYRLTMVPLTRIASTITRVGLPTFAQVQDEADRLRRGYLTSAQGVALATWPLLAGALVLAAPLLEWVNPQMLGALVTFRLLTAASALKSLGAVVGLIFLARGKADWAFYWTLFSLAVLTPAFAVGVRFGADGIATAHVVTSCLFLGLSQHLVNRLLALPYGAYLRALARPLAVAVGVLAVLWAALPLLAIRPPALFLWAALIGVATGAAGLRLFARDLSRDYWRRLRGVRGTTVRGNGLRDD